MGNETKQAQKQNEKESYQDLEANSEGADTEKASSSKEEAQQNKGLEKLEEELEEKNDLIEDLKDRIRHLKADFDNYKKRRAQRSEERTQKAEGKIIMDLVPIYDNLDRAFKSFEKNGDSESFIEGVEKIYAQFDDFLSKRDVELIEAEGERFDPNKHEALMRVESDEHEHNEIIEVFERGYKHKGKVLKPSKVKVNINPSSSGEEGENESDETKQGR